MRVSRDTLRNNGLGRFVCPSLFVLSLFLVTSALTLPARAENADAKIDRLENEIQTLSRAVYKGEQPPPGAFNSSNSGAAANAEVMSNINTRLSQLENDLRHLTGQVEQQNYDFRNYQEQMQKVILDLQMRVGTPAVAAQATTPGFAGGAAPQPGAPVTPPAAATAPAAAYPPVLTGQSAPAVPQPQLTGQQPPQTLPGALTVPAAPLTSDDSAAPPAPIPPSRITAAAPATTPVPETDVPMTAPADVGGSTDAYETAYSLLKAQKYDEAEKAFTGFLKKYPDDNLTSNAQYWLGETYYARKDYEHSARVFAEVYQKYPKSPKGADSLLKLGMSLSAMGKKSEACLTYAQLQKEYATGSSAILERAHTETDTLGCK